MEKLKQNPLLYNTKRKSAWLLLLMLPALIACKKIIRKVEVRVYNVDTNEGIPNIELFTESGGEYVTDENGCVIIKGEGNLKGQKITTRLTIEGFGHPDYLKTCEARKVYEIEEKKLEIPLLKHSYIKVIAYKKSLNPAESACVFYSGWPCIGGMSEQYVLKSDGGLGLPSNSVDNTRTILIANDADYQKVEIFYNNNCSNISTIPDTVFTVPIVKGDTTTFDVYI
ncbi:MAG: hypothetical protein KDC83_14855 [Flavobacteriales bacterium]|nr:hypothetical protein [Flavobacteriales bacterium]